MSSWPEDVRIVNFVVESRDFWIPVGLKGKFVVQHDGEVDMASGYLPLSEDLSSIFGTLKETRPTLREFNLVVCVDARFRRDESQILYDIHHLLGSDKNPPSTCGTTNTLQARIGTPIHRDLCIYQATIDRLHKRCMEEVEEYGRYAFEDDFDQSEWEWNMLETYEERSDDEAYSFDYSTSEDEDEDWYSMPSTAVRIPTNPEHLEGNSAEWPLRSDL